MAITRWEPFQDMVSLRDAMDRLFQESFIRPTTRFLTKESAMPLDIHETGNELVVTASLPGIKPEDVEITITGDLLTIKGEVKADQTVKQEDYILQEHRYGTFCRSVTIVMPVVADKAEAKFEHGVLTSRFPRRKRSSPSKSRSRLRAST